MMDLSEPAIVQDVFASGLAEAEDMGDGTMRFTFFAKQRSSYDGACIENVIVARVVMPKRAVSSAVGQAMIAAGLKCCGAQRLH